MTKLKLLKFLARFYPLAERLGTIQEKNGTSLFVTALIVSVLGVFLVHIFTHSGNTDQNNSEYGHFLRSTRDYVAM